MNQCEKALWCLSSAQFVAWELHLYLDTHPEDEDAKRQLEEQLKKVDMLRRDFEDRYGALSAKTGSGREWLKNPWPWDLEQGVR